MTTPATTTPLEGVELLACPFCGGDGAFMPRTATAGMICAGCADDDCIGRGIAYDFVTEEAAAACWNTRAPSDQTDDLVEALRAMVLNDTHTYRDCHKRARALLDRIQPKSGGAV